MTVTSGRKCLELSRNSGPLGSLEKMLLELYPWSSRAVTLEWRAEQLTDCRTQTIMRRYCHDKSTRLSSTSSEILNASDMKSRYLLFRLVPSTPRTGGTDAPLRSTVTASDWRHRGPNSRQQGLPEAVRMFPTPTARDYKCANSIAHLTRGTGKNHAGQLPNVVKLWPTAVGRCGKGPSQTATRQGGPDLQTEVGGQLNPTWVESMMGFPIDWMDLED